MTQSFAVIGTLRTAGFEYTPRRGPIGRTDLQVAADVRHHASTAEGSRELARFIGMDSARPADLVERLLDEIERGHVSVEPRPPLPMLCGPADATEVNLADLTVVELVAEEYAVELQLLDQDDEPVGGAEYQLTLPDGSIRTGVLDDRGFARVQGLSSEDPCVVCFPEFDGPSWSYVHAAPL